MANPETSRHAAEKTKMARFRVALNLDERFLEDRVIMNKHGSLKCLTMHER